MDTETRELRGTPALAIDAQALTRRFGDVLAVDQVDLHVGDGEIVGLLGPNGAGKSTTIKMLTTLLPRSGGDARVAGVDLDHAAAVRCRIGYVPQILSADGALTGRENLTLSAKLYGMSRAQREARIVEALAFMGLTGAADKRVRTYSGGMIRRLELAQAMLHRPAVLFLDEPTVGLDPVARRAVWERLLEMRREYGMAILLTTHDMEEAERLCDRIAIMHLGRIAATGSPAALKAEVGEGAQLADVFSHFSGAALQEGGDYRDVRRTRNTAHRLG